MLERIKDKILVVDDNDQNLLLMKRALKSGAVDVVTVDSGEAALDMLRVSTEFALIILDVNLPNGLSGFETAEKIQSNNLAQSTPFIFISSQYKAEADIDLGFYIGAYDYILRPIDIPLLRNKVGTFLRLYRAELELKQANFLLAKRAAKLDNELSKQIKINDNLKFSEQVFENSITGIIIVDENLKFVRVNKAFTDITGYSIDELIGKTPKILSSGVHDRAFYESMWLELRKNGTWQGELWSKRKGSELYAEMLSINAVKDHDGAVSNYIGILSDITDKKRADEKNEYLANYDFLTGLPNRHKLMNILNSYISNLETTSFAVLFLDLNKFKPVNDNYGHQVGDDLLVAVSKRLKACVRDGDIVSRLGGDEFIVVLKGANSSQKASKKVAQKVISSISSAFNISGVNISISTSIGISIYPENSENADKLITLADNAMYVSKEQGSGAFNFCAN